MQYQIIEEEAFDRLSFQRRVNDELVRGWTPIGGTSIQFNSKTGKTIWVQALCRRRAVITSSWGQLFVEAVGQNEGQ